MSRDRRYPAFLLIIAIFLGFFFFTSSTFQKESPPRTPDRSSTSTHSDGPKQVNTLRTPKSSLPVFPIDINKATVHELMLLPGIGEKTAQRIVDKRSELGGFRSIDDLTAVKWVGKVKLEKLRGLVTISVPAKGQGQPGSGNP